MIGPTGLYGASANRSYHHIKRYRRLEFFNMLEHFSTELVDFDDYAEHIPAGLLSTTGGSYSIGALRPSRVSVRILNLYCLPSIRSGTL